MKAILGEGENVYHCQMHNVPNFLLNSSISISSRNETKRLYTNTLFLPPRAMRGNFFKKSRPKNAKNHAISLLQMQTSFTTQKKECIYLLCLILMYKEIKSKSFDAPLLSIKRKIQMQMQKTQSKRGFKQIMHSKK
jgi:hypothetical protein